MSDASPTPPSPSTGRRLPALDGLRGLAILMVVPHNLNTLTAPIGLTAHTFTSLLDRGWLGVQLFFVLSGFLITGILIDSRRDPGHFAHFFISRAFRILPLYYATLLVVFGVLPWLGVHIVWPGAAWPLSLFIINWTAPFHPGNPLPHFWSLAVEEQFYLLWPFVIHRLGLRGIVCMSAALTVVAFAVRAAMLHAGMLPNAVYEFSVCRMDALACGAAAAALLRMPSARAWMIASPGRLAFIALLLTSAAGAAGSFTQFDSKTQTFGYLLLSVAFSFAVAAAACGDLKGSTDRTLAFLRRPWLRRVGLYSYAMYVLHVPLARYIGTPIVRWLVPSHTTSLPTAVVGVTLGTIAAYGAGALSHRYFESWFVRQKQRWQATHVSRSAAA